MIATVQASPVAFGEDLWEAGRLQFDPLVPASGHFRALVIDLAIQQPLLAWSYANRIAPAARLGADQAEITWADAGTIRIVAHVDGVERRWYWSQLHRAWEIDSAPPESVAECLLTAVRCL